MKQQQRERTNGHNRNGFCGAYGYNGFHDDGASHLHQSEQDE